MLGRVPTCATISSSDGHGGIGFSDGSVSLWTSSSLRSLLEAAEAAERVGRLGAGHEDREEGTIDERDEGDPGTNDYPQDSLQSFDGKMEAVEEAAKGIGADEAECIDALTFVMRWDEATGKDVGCDIKFRCGASATGLNHQDIPIQASCVNPDKPSHLLFRK